MTNETILKKVIMKARKNGWKKEYSVKELLEEVTLTGDADALAMCIIYSHSFAKAFWKKDLIMDVPGSWQYHLQQMVVEKEPLKYIEKFLNIKGHNQKLTKIKL